MHGPQDVRLAVGPGLPVALLSGRGAGGYAGAAWWRALVGDAARLPGVVDVLDCGDAPGFAFAALRVGQRLIMCDAGAAADALASAAASVGATILAARPEALDLADPGAARRVEAWLRRRDAAGG